MHKISWSWTPLEASSFHQSVHFWQAWINQWINEAAAIESLPPVPDLSMWRPWAGSLLEAPTHPQML